MPQIELSMNISIYQHILTGNVKGMCLTAKAGPKLGHAARQILCLCMLLSIHRNLAIKSTKGTTQYY